MLKNLSNPPVLDIPLRSPISVILQNRLSFYLTFYKYSHFDAYLSLHRLHVHEMKTSRERPKSAPYLRLKIKKGDPSGFVKLQLVAKILKIEGGTLWRHEKISQKIFFNEIFEQCHSAEKCKRGDPLRFFDVHCVAKHQKIEGGTLWGKIFNPKSFKKSHSSEKKWGDLKCDFEVVDVCFVFSFRFGRASEVGVVGV